MDSPSPPQAPDPTATANAQTSTNLQTAQAQGIINNPNIKTPYGQQTVTWAAPGFDQSGYDAALGKYQNDLNAWNSGPQGQSFSPETGQTFYDAKFGTAPTAPDRAQFQGTGAQQPTVTQSLSPQQQALFDSQNRISQYMAGIGERGLMGIGNTLGSPLDSGSGTDATNKAYAAMTSRLDPQWQQAQQQQETQLRNQGIDTGSEAYQNAMRTFNQGKNDAYQQANLGAMGYAPTQQQLDISGRLAPLNELNALRTGAQVQNPQFQPYSGANIAPTNTMSAQQMYQNGLMGGYNAEVGSANNFNSGLMSMAGTAAMAFAV